MELKPIGVIHSPHKESTGAPIQSALAAGIEGMVEVFPEFAAGLKDIEGFDRIWLVYWFDRTTSPSLLVTPYLDTGQHGIFATRAPCRPNAIGISSVRLIEVRSNLLRVEGLDVLDNTPLLDIKPYLPAFDAFRVERTGWFRSIQNNSTSADDRFEAKC